MSSRKKIILPILIYVFVIFSVPLSFKLKIPNIHYFIVGIFTPLFFAVFLKKGSKVNRYHAYLLNYALYFLLISVCEILFLDIELKYSIASFVSLLWCPLFFIFYPIRITSDLLKEFLRWQFYIAVLVAVLGIIQYYISRDLFGFIPRIWYDVLYEDYSFTFRASSILYSIQVYALYCVTYAIIIIEKKELFPPITRYLFFVLLFFGGFLSGSKSVIVIFAFYLLVKYLLSRRKLLILITSSLFILAIINANKVIKDDTIIRTFGWLSEFSEFREKENEGRISVYSNLIEESNLILGNLAGSSNSKNPDYINPESYLLQLYSEGGIVLVVLFIFFFFSSLIYFYRFSQAEFLVFFSVFLSLSFVHTFDSPAFFGIWGYFIFSLDKQKEISG